MTHWRVDPDGVVGVLAGVDELGPEFESAQTSITDAAGAASALSVDGRTTLSNAWVSFMHSRALVPGKILHSVSDAASRLSRATVAITTGDDEMTTTTQAAQHAQDAWGLDIAGAYHTPDVSEAL